jgi:hypothetical protein
MQILGSIGSLVAFVVGIMVLIKLFKQEGALKGVLGFICMLYTFVWGWMNIGKEELGLKTLMYVWTGVVVVAAILNVIGAMSGTPAVTP